MAGEFTSLAGPRARSVVDRILTLVVEDDNGCWQFTGRRSLGYPQISDELGRTVRAHRAMYERRVGPIPDGYEVDHLCFNRSCVNPAHLEAVTPEENKRRAVDHYRGPQRTTCVNGHDLTPENCYVPPSHPTGKVCRLCELERNRRRRAAARARRSPSS
ncbi:HNH endonuclease signature motif containing protein [Kitasatospora cathayae]|uniref:HNH endonuclease signature motif containing protein n=1 Tax=Kitasatospora cathayae TaxID=3004092 RepID=A0ABY7QA01_9ACTN|nr:HNH endonuclease signature motif containing protein [Kitasatospora sp. HUAS 3-15]WBP89502.1 HNH endonuclease signature motif containing protein [Kitasatospora sp. HUAS 3-15]